MMLSLFSSTFYSSPAVNLDKANAAAGFPRRHIDPHNQNDVHLSIQDDAFNEVEKIKPAVDVCRLLSVLLWERGRNTDSGVVTILGTSGASLAWN